MYYQSQGQIPQLQQQYTSNQPLSEGEQEMETPREERRESGTISSSQKETIEDMISRALASQQEQESTKLNEIFSILNQLVTSNKEEAPVVENKRPQHEYVEPEQLDYPEEHLKDLLSRKFNEQKYPEDVGLTNSMIRVPKEEDDVSPKSVIEEIMQTPEKQMDIVEPPSSIKHGPSEPSRHEASDSDSFLPDPDLLDKLNANMLKNDQQFGEDGKPKKDSEEKVVEQTAKVDIPTKWKQKQMARLALEEEREQKRKDLFAMMENESNDFDFVTSPEEEEADQKRVDIDAEVGCELITRAERQKQIEEVLAVVDHSLEDQQETTPADPEEQQSAHNTLDHLRGLAIMKQLEREKTQL